MSKNAMFNITYGLFVITATVDGKDNGCITNTLMQVTTEPNRVCVTINKSNYTHDMIMTSKKFTASVINQKADFELFKRFGFQSGRSVNKFEGFKDCARGLNGVLVITKGINSFISADVINTIDLGTHTMFIADVTDTGVLNDVPSADYAYFTQTLSPSRRTQARKHLTGKRYGVVTYAAMNMSVRSFPKISFVRGVSILLPILRKS